MALVYKVMGLIWKVINQRFQPLVRLQPLIRIQNKIINRIRLEYKVLFDIRYDPRLRKVYRFNKYFFFALFSAFLACEVNQLHYNEYYFESDTIKDVSIKLLEDHDLKHREVVESVQRINKLVKDDNYDYIE